MTRRPLPSPFLAFFALVLLCPAGCGGKNTYPVKGTVTWNGQPMAEGKIVLEDENPRVLPAAGDVKAGTFTLEAPAGKKKVRIHASREVPGAKKDPAMGAVPRQEYVPRRYNADTTLSAEVKPEGPNEFTFSLKE